MSRFSTLPTSMSSTSAKGRQHQDAGHHGVDVERTLGLENQVTDALRRAEVFADDRTDEGQADARVQAGKDPARGAGQYTWRSSCLLLAPSIRALASTTG
jgi:hypothetical protein